MGWFDYFRPKRPQDQAAATLPNSPNLTPQKVDRWQKTVENKFYEAAFGFNPEQMMRIGYFKQQDVRKWSDGAYNLSSQLVTLWSQAVTSRRDYIMISEEMRKFYLVDRLLELITQDVLNADENGKIVKLIAKDGREDLQDELEEFEEGIDLNLLLTEITQDFIDFGEYAISMEIEKEVGLTRWRDDVDPLNIVAFYDAGFPSNYLVYKDKDFQVLPAHHYCHFVLGNNKLRVRMEDQLTSGFGLANEPDLPTEVRDKLPDYIRIGKPFFLGVMSKLRELQLLEQLIPAAKLNMITQSSMVSLNVPPTMTNDKVQEAVQQYEELLNVPSGLDFTRNQISLAEIMTAAGKIRVVPNWTDGKGALDTMNLRANPNVDDILHSVQDIRAVILTSLGIPPSLLFGGTGADAEKFNELKLYSQYTRRLAYIQKALQRGIKQMVVAHLVNKGVRAKPGDFDVVFIQTLVDLSGLERLEFNDAETEILDRFLDFTKKMKEHPILGPTIDEAAIARWMQSQFNTLVNGENIFKVPIDGDQIKKGVRKVAKKIQDIVTAAKKEPSDDDAGNQLPNDGPIDPISTNKTESSPL